MDKDYFNMGTYGVPPYYGFENMNTDSTPNPMDTNGMFYKRMDGRK